MLRDYLYYSFADEDSDLFFELLMLFFLSFIMLSEFILNLQSSYLDYRTIWYCA